MLIMKVGVCVKESQEESGWDTFWQSSLFFRNNHLFPLQCCVTSGLPRRQTQMKTSVVFCRLLSLSLLLLLHLTLVLVTVNEWVWLCHWKRWSWIPILISSSFDRQTQNLNVNTLTLAIRNTISGSHYCFSNALCFFAPFPASSIPPTPRLLLLFSHSCLLVWPSWAFLLVALLSANKKHWMELVMHRGWLCLTWTFRVCLDTEL